MISEYHRTCQCSAGSFLTLYWVHLARSQPLLCFLSTWIPSLWLFSGSFTAPWSSLLQSREQYCLAWESKYLMELGNALDSLLNGFVNMMAQEALKFTVLSGKNLNHITSTLVQFHYWCLFKVAFLNKDGIWEGISFGSIGIALQKSPKNLLCHTYNFSWIALPLCHWLGLKIMVGNTLLYVCLCLFLYIITLCFSALHKPFKHPRYIHVWSLFASISEHQILSYLQSSKTFLRSAVEKEELKITKGPRFSF